MHAQASPSFSPLVWLQATRLPFSTASLTAAFVGLGAVAAHPAYSWTHALLATAGALFLHLSANTLNDWRDWNASDRVNPYAGPFNGGSRVRLEGRIRQGDFLILGLFFLALAGVCGILLLAAGKTVILLPALAGAFLGTAYSVPPFSLQARGLGEIAIAAAFGPLLTGGAAAAATGVWQWNAFWMGVPAGLLTSNILFINQFPDRGADESVGKRHWVVRLGTRRARWGYLLMALFALAFTLALPFFAEAPRAAWTSTLGFLPLFKAVPELWRHHGDPMKLAPAQQATIAAQALSQSILALMLFIF